MAAGDPETDVRELFRFRRGDITEAYGLRVVRPVAELWRLTYRGETLEKSEQLHTFTDPQEALKFLVAMKDRFQKEGLL
jgi:hypothetical protein